MNQAKKKHEDLSSWTKIEIEEIGIEPTNVFIVMTKARVTKRGVVAALKTKKGDIISTIRELTRASSH